MMKLLLFVACITLPFLVEGSDSARNRRKLHHISWSPCANVTYPLNVSNIDVQPMPIAIPGLMYLTLDGSFLSQISNATLKISLKRKTWLLDIPIPCLQHWGSCTYKNMCHMLEDMIADNWGGAGKYMGFQINTLLKNSGFHPGQCPIDAKEFHVRSYRFELPYGLDSSLGFLVEGDYKAKVELKDNASGHELFCLNVVLTLKISKDNGPAVG